MRYWLHGVDEDYERELQRVARLGGTAPLPMSRLEVTAAVILVLAQVICSMGVVFVALERFR